MTESVWLWSRTAASNDDADGAINWAENQAPSTLNNSARSMMAALAKLLYDISGGILSTGSTNEYTIATQQGLAAHANGVLIAFRADKTSTGAATTTIDGLAVKSIYRADGTATASGDIVLGGIYMLAYSSVGATGYLLLNVNPGANAVTAGSTVTDNSIIRGDGTARGIQTSVVSIDDTTGSLYPETTDSGSLGTTSKNWSDLFLDLGAVINFDSGDVTITHSANTLTFAGASSGYAFDVAPNVAGSSVLLANSTTVAFLNVEDQAVTGGVRVTVKDLGTISSGTVTPDPGDRPHQKYVNGGAHTLAPGTNQGSYWLDITNDGSAGAITTSGWTKVAGSSFTTTNGHKFACVCHISDLGSLLSVQAMQ